MGPCFENSAQPVKIIRVTVSLIYDRADDSLPTDEPKLQMVLSSVQNVGQYLCARARACVYECA